MTAPPAPLGLYTDLYELRMLESYLRLGMTEPATFSLFVRPTRARPVLVTCGLDVALDVLDRFRFGPEEIAYLRGQGIAQAALDWLAEMTPVGELWAVPDGTVLLGDEPLLEMTAPMPVAQLLEAALMNAMHGPTVVASKAARLVRAARGRAIVDFGFRRAHGLETGVRAAVAAYVGGIAATSCVEAGRRFGVPIAGTMAHSFVQAFDHEQEALYEFAADHPGTTLLVDTYDTLEGVAAAIRVARELAGRGVRVGGLRIDSAPLGELGRAARAMLDDAGLRDVKIFASGGLDEEELAELTSSGAPYDAFGIGSALICSTDRPALDIAYKLVEYAGVGRVKYSRDKATLPGRKQVLRAGAVADDVLELRGAAGDRQGLLELVWRDGERRYRFDPEAARRRAAAALEPLPDQWLLPPGPDVPPRPTIGPALAAEVEAVRRRLAR